MLFHSALLRSVTTVTQQFLSDPGIPGVRSMGPSLSHSQANVCETYTSYTSGVIWWPNLELMQVAPSGDQLWNQAMQVMSPDDQIWSMYTEKVTVSSGAIWWPNLELMQVAPSGDQIWN